MLVNFWKISWHDVFWSQNHIPKTPSQWMVYTWADVTYLWPRGHFKGSRRRNKHYVFQPKILYKVIITKDRVNGVCWITFKCMNLKRWLSFIMSRAMVVKFVHLWGQKPICPNQADYGHAIQYDIGSFPKTSFWVLRNECLVQVPRPCIEF